MAACTSGSKHFCLKLLFAVLPSSFLCFREIAQRRKIRQLATRVRQMQRLGIKTTKVKFQEEFQRDENEFPLEIDVSLPFIFLGSLKFG